MVTITFSRFINGHKVKLQDFRVCCRHLSKFICINVHIFKILLNISPVVILSAIGEPTGFLGSVISC